MLFDLGAVDALTDGQLLERFGARRGAAAEPAFEALVERHGPMVLRACRSILRDEHEAQDAFQATFLVLARKAGSLAIRADGSLAPWLYRVGSRVALRARTTSARRRTAERHAAEIATARSAVEEPSGLGPTLCEEIDRLADRYRAAVILCDLEGQTYEEAARRLGCPVGTIKSRLARGRERLRSRLARRGLAPALIVRTAMMPTASRAAIAPALVGSTSRLAIEFAEVGMVPASSGALARGFLEGMMMTKIKTAGVVLAAGLLATSAGAIAILAAGSQEPKEEAGQPIAQQPEAKPVAEADRRMAKLLEDRTRACQEALEQANESFRAGTTDIETYYNWSKRFMESEIASSRADNPSMQDFAARKLRAVSTHLTRMKALEKVVQAMHEAARTSLMNVKSTAYFRIEAAVWVLEAEAAAGVPRGEANPPGH